MSLKHAEENVYSITPLTHTTRCPQTKIFYIIQERLNAPKQFVNTLNCYTRTTCSLRVTPESFNPRTDEDH